MPVVPQAGYLVALVVGFGLVIGGGYTAFYIASGIQETAVRALAGLLAVATILAGIVVIAKSFSKVEAASKPTNEPHLPGMDVEVEETEKPLR